MAQLSERVILEAHQWEKEWQDEVKCASIDKNNYGSMGYLDQFHAFVLSNVLRRPVFLYSPPKLLSQDEGITLQNVDFHGLYLPLLWNPRNCVKDPLPIVYYNGHFSALSIIDNRAEYTDGCLLFPLCDYYHQDLPVRFMMEGEFAYRLKMDYLNTGYVNDATSRMVLCAKLELTEQPKYMKPLLSGFIDCCFEAYRKHVGVAKEEVSCQRKNKEYVGLKESHDSLIISFKKIEEEHHKIIKSYEYLMTKHQGMEDTQQELVKRMEDLQTELRYKEDELLFLQKKVTQLENSWRISHNEVKLLETELGRGGWGVIVLGQFRGQKVAVKQIHELIKSDKYLELLHREINTMSQLRHPNLLQFIGAVLDHPSGNPMIITEVMDTSLRKAYENKELTPHPSCRPVILSIMRDVAVGLNYLHCLPDPIIHRDVSSANVLLESKGPRKWKTKISDFGSANLVQQAVTKAPGAVVYSAPEAHQTVSTFHRKSKRQTTKMDSFSYGVLLCEMMACKFPSVGTFPDLLHQVKASSSKPLYDLIVSCIDDEPDRRPSMEQIIMMLDHS